MREDAPAVAPAAQADAPEPDVLEPDAPEPIVACARCGARFRRAAHLALHAGRRHADALDARERAAFDAALAEEAAWLQRFRRHMRGALGAMVPLSITGLVLLGVHVAGAPVAYALLSVPPAIGFAGIAYVFALQQDDP